VVHQHFTGVGETRSAHSK